MGSDEHEEHASDISRVQPAVMATPMSLQTGEVQVRALANPVPAWARTAPRRGVGELIA